MNDVTKFIESGILELYVLGQTTAEENTEVEQMAIMHTEVHNEIDDISIALEQYARAHAVTPDPMIQPFLMATIDYMDRMKNGEAPAFPPALFAGSTIAHYAEWLNRTDLEPTEEVTDIHASIIGNAPGLLTAIVWLKHGSPAELHTNELETFMIVEGTCDITIGDTVHSLKPGNVLTIPLHMNHWVTVTSDCLCKIVLQRAAA